MSSETHCTKHVLIAHALNAQKMNDELNKCTTFDSNLLKYYINKHHASINADTVNQLLSKGQEVDKDTLVDASIYISSAFPSVFKTLLKSYVDTTHQPVPPAAVKYLCRGYGSSHYDLVKTIINEHKVPVDDEIFDKCVSMDNNYTAQRFISKENMLMAQQESEFNEYIYQKYMETKGTKDVKQSTEASSSDKQASVVSFLGKWFWQH